jgi:hypothetical protein
MKNISQKNIYGKKSKIESYSLPKKNNKRNNLLNKNRTMNNSLKHFTENNKNNKAKYKIQKVNQIKITNAPLIKQRNIYHSKTQTFVNNNSQLLKGIYSKEFPSKIKTNDVLKLMLFLNEYIINNNLLDDYYLPQNRKILDEYSQFLSSKINVNYPKEIDISIDNVVNKVKCIQRFWRKRKIKSYLKQKRVEKKNEIKRMIVNNYIQKSGFKTKKVLGLFHNLLENFLLNIDDEKSKINDNDINKTFYFIKKLILKEDLTLFEENELYKDYINNIIYKK